MGEGDRLESLGWYQEMLMAKVSLEGRGYGPGAEHFHRRGVEEERRERTRGSGNWSAFCLEK